MCHVTIDIELPYTYQCALCGLIKEEHEDNDGRSICPDCVLHKNEVSWDDSAETKK